MSSRNVIAITPLSAEGLASLVDLRASRFVDQQSDLLLPVQSSAAIDLSACPRLDMVVLAMATIPPSLPWVFAV